MRIIKNVVVLCCCLVGLFLTSCSSKNSDTVNGDGNIIKHEVAVNIYNEIKVEGAIDVVYETKPDQAAYLLVEADDNIIPLIDIQVKGNTLQIKSRESINPSRFIVYTNSPSLKYIESKGASNITLNGTIVGQNLKIEMKGTGDLEANNLVYEKGEFKLIGAGNIKMAGQIQKAQYEIAGSGDINASSLTVNDLQCKLKGAGDMEVNAIDKMSIEISGAGNILYKGNPQITKQNIKGSGTVRVL